MLPLLGRECKKNVNGHANLRRKVAHEGLRAIQTVEINLDGTNLKSMTRDIGEPERPSVKLTLHFQINLEHVNLVRFSI